MDEAVPVWGGLVRQLSLVPDGPPANGGNSTTSRRGPSSGVTTCRQTGNGWAGPSRAGCWKPRWRSARPAAPSGRRSGRDVLVHTDLHYLNILARPRAGEPEGSGREPADGFAAIDPQPMIGEAEFAVAPLLWNRIGTCPGGSADGACGSAAATSAWPPGWTPRSPGSGASPARWRTPSGTPRSPRHGGDLARSLWVASTLAGRTLAGASARMPARNRARRQRRRSRTASAVWAAADRPPRPSRTAATATCHVVVVRAPVADRDPQDVPALPARSGHPDPAVRDDPRRHRPGGGVVAEGQRDLGVVDVVEHLDAVQRGQLLRQLPGVQHQPADLG